MHKFIIITLLFCVCIFSDVEGGSFLDPTNACKNYAEYKKVCGSSGDGIDYIKNAETGKFGRGESVFRNAGFDGVVLFGDSLSDQGNFLFIANAFTPFFKDLHLQSPPSSHCGRAFTNRALIPEYIANYYGFSLSPAWKDSFRISEIKEDVKDEFDWDRDIIFLNRLLHPSKGVNGDEKDNFFDDIDEVGAKNIEIYLNRLSLIMSKINSSTGNNYAIARATFSDYSYKGFEDYLFSNFNVPKQIEHYMRHRNSGDVSSKLFIVFAGGNDAVEIFREKDISKRKLMIRTAASDLIYSLNVIKNQIGARKILVSSVPDLSIAPGIIRQGEDAIEAARVIVRDLNDAINKEITHNFSGKDVLLLDIIKPLIDAVNSFPKDNRKINCTTDIAFNRDFSRSELFHCSQLSVKFSAPCTQCTINDYPFFDMVHSTDGVYRAIANDFIKHIDNFLMKSN